MLAAQVVTLNSMFTHMLYEVSKMDIVDHIDRFTKLAFKAQSQCRATVETLAQIKSPPVVIAHQANVAHGPQQVNNLVQSPSTPNLTGARAENSQFEQNKLLEAHGERLDAGASRSTIGSDQPLASLGRLNGPSLE
jgi:hypothetical protein